MKKVLLIGGLAVVVAIGIVIWRVWANLDVIVAEIIEETGTEAMQTPVKVSGVKLALTEGKAAIEGLSINNPPGFSDPNVFTLNEIAVDLDLATISNNPIVINEILIRRPEVFFEVNDKNESNLDVLKKRMEANQQGTKEKPKAEAAGEPSGEPIKLIINKVLFEGGHISAKSDLKPDKQLEAKLPRIQMHDLGKSQGGATPAKIAEEITRQLVDQAVQASTKLATQWAIDQAKQKGKEALQKELGKSLDGLLQR
ncbi:MAG: hypothetical protein GY807_07050 [Gammaproteobacteria bacterium]|nr:hypothetical protein [Gammaproteobacteria bacterium]